MTFHPFSVTAPHIAYTCIGGFVVLFGMFSLFIREKLYIGEACWAFLFGVVIGPNGGNIFNPRDWAPSNSNLIDSQNMNTITLEITRVVLAIGVFAIGVELPKQYMKNHWKSLFFLLVPVMSWGWFVSAGLIFGLIPGLTFLSSLAVAACLTPTDPILAAAVVGGKYADKHVPTHLRHLLAAESGCNDGAAFPFLFIALYLALEQSSAHAVQDWFLITFLYEVLLGVVFGAVLGFGFRHLMRFCERKDLIDRKSYVAQYVSLALLSIGSTTLLGSDDLLSAFASGTAFAWDGFFNKQTEDSAFSSVIDLLFNIAAFIYIGAWMPFHLFSSAELTLTVWRLVVLAILILLLRRLPIVIALYHWIPDIKTFREAFFSGHFGPIGVGAVFISTLAVERLPRPHDPPSDEVEMLAASIQPIVAFMVLCSITIHGLSIPFFSLSRRVHSVSRTWSRHPSTDLAGPEWTTQTRRVVRGEDVVINRDRGDDTDMMERGESDKDEFGMKVLGNGGKEGDQESPLSEEIPQDENPPDGERRPGDDSEWREGPDLIIEHDHGPGKEVEVDVIRNAFPESGQHEPKAAPPGSDDTIHRMVGKHTQNLMQRPKDMEPEATCEPNDESVNMREQAEKDRQHTKDMILHDHEEHAQVDEGHEEDWSDDDADSEGVGPGPSSATARSVYTEKKRSKVLKHQFVKPPVFSQSRVSAGKRRESFRRGVLAARHSGVAPSSASTAASPGGPSQEKENPQRGRDFNSKDLPRLHIRQSFAPSGSGAHTPHSSISRLRSDSLRAESPARSVRFADEPATPASGSRSGTRTPITDDVPSGGANEDATTRMVFDIPRRPGSSGRSR